MGDFGFWLFLIFSITLMNLDEVGDALRGDCSSEIIEETVDG